MSSHTLRDYLKKLDLTPEIADIYQALHRHGPQTISQLARSSSIERTLIYRLMGELAKTGLIEVESQPKHTTLKAAPIGNLRILIDQKESQLESLKQNLHSLEQAFTSNSLESPTTKVQFYSGPEGIRQMLWNELKAKSEVVGYQYRILEEATGNKYMERWSDEFEARNLKQRLVYADAYIESWNENKTGVATQRKINGIDYRYLPKVKFAITHSCDVYDNVTAYYHWADSEIFGIEIYNHEIANSQRQLFELLWPHAKVQDGDFTEKAFLKS